MAESCLDCSRQADCVFYDLAPETLAAFDVIKSARTLGKGTVLFRQGQPAAAIFLVCDGRVRLSVRSSSGQQIQLRTASSGEVLGLSAALSATVYEVTAEIVENATVACVRRKELLQFLRQHCDACLHVVNQLSEDLHLAYDRVRALAMGRPRHPHSLHIH